MDKNNLSGNNIRSVMRTVSEHVSDITEKTYHNKCRTIIKKCENATGTFSKESLKIFLPMMIPTIKRTSWFVYRSAILHCLGEDWRDVVDSVKWRDATEKKVQGQSKAKEVTRTELSKLIGENRFSECHSLSSTSKLPRVYTARLIIEASIITGARPCELFDAYLKQDQYERNWLVIHTRKQVRDQVITGDYPHSKREICLNWSHWGKSESLSDFDYNFFIINRILDIVNHLKESFRDEVEQEHFLTKLCIALSHTKTRLKEEDIKIANITLYSGRHQFASDLKSSGLTKSEIGFLLGHKGTAHVKTYGDKRSGNSNRSLSAELLFSEIHQKITSAQAIKKRVSSKKGLKHEKAPIKATDKSLTTTKFTYER